MNRTIRTCLAAAACLLVLASCPSPLMDAVRVKVMREESKVITLFGFTMAANPKVYRDIVGVVDESAHAITVTVPKWIPLTNLVATFEFEGASVSVDGVAQESGVTAHDFTSPLVYTVTPVSGDPVTYTVTATTGLQGLRGGSIQGKPLVLDGIVDTMAGQASIFGDPAGCVIEGTNIFIADYAYHVIRKIEMANNFATSVFAGTLGEPGSDDGLVNVANFWNPYMMTSDGTYLYVSDFSNGMIRKVSLASGGVSTLVSDLSSPVAIHYYHTLGILYEMDFDYLNGYFVLRTVDRNTGALSTVGTYTPSDSEWPVDLVRNGDMIYVADQGMNSIWCIDVNTPGSYTIFAGNNDPAGGWNNGTGTSAIFTFPSALALSGNDLYVADYGNNEIRKIYLPTASVTTYAGSYDQGGTRDGLLDAMLLYGPQGICLSDGIMIIAESGNKIIRKIQSSSGSTIAGTPPGSTNGVGSATRFYIPRNLSTDGASIWVVDGFNHVLRSLDPAARSVGTLAGVVQANQSVIDEWDDIASAALFSYPSGITQVGSLVFVCDNIGQTIRKLDLVTGQVTTFAGKLFTAGSSEGIGTAAQFNGPTSITNDGEYLYVVDSGNHTIRRITIATAQVTKIAGMTGVIGHLDGPGDSATFKSPFGITTDGTSLFVTDRGNYRIRQIDIATGVVSTLAGPTGSSEASYVNGTGSAARFRLPRGITTDGTYLYVADTNNHVIRRIEIATAIVDTVAGPAAPDVKAGEVDGTGTAARFNSPYGITTDGTCLFVSDIGGNTIRRIR